MTELLDLETSLEELEGIEKAKHILIPINADLENFKERINELNFPVWLKLNSGEHKAKLDAVAKCHDFEELKKTHEKFMKTFKEKSFLIQENVHGIEIIIGIKQDKTFGKTLLIGAGGSFTELIKDTEIRVLPINEEQIQETIQKLKIYEILEQKKANLSKLIKLIHKFSTLDIQEADLNPVIVNAKKAVVVDARVVI